MLVDKDTKLYCSFAKQAGSTGCAFHNAGFSKHGINAVYKSFSVTDIGLAIQAMKTLDIKGAGITMPFKTDIIKYVDRPKQEVLDINACNTIVNDNGIITGYNTDYLSVLDYLKPLSLKRLVILGNGGYAKSVIRACRDLKIDYKSITRRNWSEIHFLKNHTVFNCTPLRNIILDPSVNYIDCSVEADTGKKLAYRQAEYQFKIYTGINY